MLVEQAEREAQLKLETSEEEIAVTVMGENYTENALGEDKGITHLSLEASNTGVSNSSEDRSEALSRVRVKVYELDDDGRWFERGDGCVSCENAEVNESMSLVVRSQSDDSTVILNSKVRKEEVYHRQQDTLIVWTESTGLDLALSFQFADGKTIKDIQESLKIAEHPEIVEMEGITETGREFSEMDGSEEVDEMTERAEKYFTRMRFPRFMRNESQSAFEELESRNSLPEPKIGSLKELEDSLVIMTRSLYGRDRLYCKKHYVEKILSLLGECEDLEMTEDLFCLSHILRMIIFLNDTAIYDVILKDENFLNVVGIFEYDREYKSAKAEFREHINNNAHFKQILPIREPSVIQNIQHSYRLQFLKDVAMARLLDDQTFGTITSLIYFNNLEILNYFQKNEQYLANIFEFFSNEHSEEKKNEAIKFVLEVCGIIKSQPATQRAGFFRLLSENGLFTIFDSMLTDTLISVRLDTVAILSCILEHDPMMVRTYCLAQVKQGKKPLVEILIERFLNESDDGLRSQLSELIKILLDTTLPETQQRLLFSRANESDDFLTYFYENFMEKLADPILSLEFSPETNTTIGTTKPLSLNLSNIQAQLCHFVCELLCYMIQYHSYRSKYFVMGTVVLNKTALLLKSKVTYVRLSALRVFRKCIGMKDEFYNRHLVKIEVLPLIFENFLEIGSKNTLLNSAFLDFFEFIRKENMKILITPLVADHRKELESITFVDIFQGLILRFDQIHDTLKPADNDPDGDKTPILAIGKDGYSKVDQDEEAYFNENSDEDEHEEKVQIDSPPLPSSSTSSMVSLTTGISAVVTSALNSVKQKFWNSKPLEFVRASTTSEAGKSLVEYDDEEDDEIFQAKKSENQKPAKRIIGFRISPALQSEERKRKSEDEDVDDETGKRLKSDS
ncbi:Platinum sensitivity protein [Nowakowskiella sp. JEL0078]|nr:Platinum sensitivity protein [Nowakowskiella sp. JEL0078]